MQDEFRCTAATGSPACVAVLRSRRSGSQGEARISARPASADTRRFSLVPCRRPSRRRPLSCARSVSRRQTGSFTSTPTIRDGLAIAKGARKTRSRFGGRLEPLSHVELVLHQGRGDSRPSPEHRSCGPASTRDDAGRLAVGLIGAEAVLRLFPEQERNERVFTAITRFLDLLDEADVGAVRPELDPLGSRVPVEAPLAFRLSPAHGELRECGSAGPITGFSPRAGGAVCGDCARDALVVLSAGGLSGIDALPPAAAG